MASGSGTYCSAWGCDRRFSKEAGIPFHKFLLKEKERLKIWLIAMRRDDFKPTIHSRICAKHFVTTDCHPFSIYLKNTAIPSVFDFPEHLKKNTPVTRREIQRISLHPNKPSNRHQKKLKHRLQRKN